MDSLTTVLRAIADPTRRTVLDLLRDGGRSASDLAEHFSTSRPAVSKHLGVLRDAGLVVARRDGRQQIYELIPGALAEIGEWLGGHPSGETREAVPAKRPRRGRPAGDDWRSW